MNEYCFSTKITTSYDGLSYALDYFFRGELPVIVCVGTDATIGDALGPIVGTMLKKANLPCFIYGTLDKPITAKEIVYIKKFLASTHPYSKVLVIDAAVGRGEDVGFIKLSDCGIKPGLGADKNLPEIGNVSIIGIVAERSPQNKNLFHFTRLGAVYSFAEIIARGVEEYIQKSIKFKDIGIAK